MEDQEKSKEDLAKELAELRTRVAELELTKELMQEIENRKRMEERLGESEAYMTYMKGVLKAAPIGIGMVKNRVLEWLSDRMSEMLGYSAGELVGRSAKVAYESDEEFERVGKVKYAEIQKQGTGTVETRLKCKDGSILDVLLCSSAIDPADLSKGAIFTALDVTERMQAEQQLRESEQRYRSLFKNNHSVMLLVDPVNAEIVDANPAACSFYGWTQEELTSMKITDINILSSEQVFQEMERAKSEERNHFFFRHRLASEEIRDVEVYSGPIKLHGKELLYSIIHDISERKRAEQALRESEEKYSNLFHHSNDAIFVHDLDGNLLDVNSKALDQFGYSKSEISSMKVPDLHPAKALEESRWAFETITQTGFVNFETVFKKKTGKLFDAEVSSSLFEIEGREVIQGIVRDITQRKRAEEELRESEERFRELAELLPQPVFEMDLEANFTYSNRCGFEAFGYNQDDMEKGLNALEVFIPEERERVQKNILKKLTGEEFKDHEYTGLRKDGSTFPVLIYSSPMIKKDKPVGVRGIVLDITERRQVEEALRESVENFRALAENANDGILIAAGEGVHVYANKRAAEITNYSVDELLEIGLKEVVAPDEVEEVADKYKRRLAGENVPGQYETAFIKKSGESFSAELSSARTVWEGQPASIVIIRDITERKQTEEALRQREAELKVHADELQEVNTALRVLLKGREKDKTELEEKILTNVKELVAPCLERLRNTELNANQAAHVETLESNLTDIISPFAHRLSSKYLNLTPREIQIANLIKEGRTTKEIAEMLNSSSRTIESHRKNIRKKIGIHKKKVNLRSQLLSM